MKVILVIASGSSLDEKAMRQAAGIAAKEGSEIDVLFIKSDPMQALPPVAEGLTAELIEELKQAMERDDAARLKNAKGAFEAVFAKASGVRWFEKTGRAAEIVAADGRLADLLIMMRPVKGEDKPGERAALEAALMETRRPVMLISPDKGQVSAFSSAVLAWNNTPEAGAALAASLPLLKRCKAVTVVTISDRRTDAQPPTDVGAYLRRQGITASTKTISGEGIATEDALLREAAALGSDLLVMGAYSHSRMRELFFGGVTEYMISYAGMPVLLAH